MAQAAYPWIMKRAPGSALAASGARRVARIAAWGVWGGLLRVLVGPDPPPAWKLRSPKERRTAYAALGMATLALSIISVASMHGVATSPGHLTGISPALAGRSPLSLWQRAVAVAVVAPLPLAARYPVLAWRIAWIALLLVPLVPVTWWGGWPWGPPQVLALLVAFCLAGVRHRRASLWWLWALTLIPWWLWLQADVANLNGPAGATAAFTAVAIAVDSFGSRLQAQRALAAQTARTQAERARLAVLEERTRIARELHDVVAHHMSLIAVQAETAPYRLSDLPEPARAEFSSLSAGARAALADMRRLLGVLRSDQPAGLAPQPQLSDLPALVDATRRAGVPVELSVLTGLDQVPSGVGVCAYRIVQESLSNASQHAPGAAVTVSVEQVSSAVLLRVANGPGGPAGQAGPAGNEPGPGHGLTGMRERVALLGGSLSAGPAHDGGFVVSATLPLGMTA
jgi:signal transduction histidine kinase